MREIKFRAWDKHCKDMVVISAMDWDENSAIGVHKDGMLTFGYLFSGFDLMQFTGLKDKNGKEIHEGDIFRIDEPPRLWKLPEDGICQVEWVGAGFWPFSNDLVDCERGEVIGNIHENPELLKQ